MFVFKSIKKLFDVISNDESTSYYEVVLNSGNTIILTEQKFNEIKQEVLNVH
jgi:hypothetical protein